MAMVKLLIQIPHAIKAKLDALRQQGTTSSGFISQPVGTRVSGTGQKDACKALRRLRSVRGWQNLEAREWVA